MSDTIGPGAPAVTPATDAEVDRFRVSWTEWWLLSLIARIDAERARADGWERIAADLRTAKSGVTYGDVRAALAGVEAGEQSFGRLVEAMRGAVETEIQRRFVEDGKARDAERARRELSEEKLRITQRNLDAARADHDADAAALLARAEKAEAELTKWRTANMSDHYASGHYEQACDERDEWKARAEGLERQLVAITDRLRDDTATLTARAERAEAALRGVALRNGDDGPCFCSVAAGPHHLSCLNARAALSRKGGG